MSLICLSFSMQSNPAISLTEKGKQIVQEFLHQLILNVKPEEPHLIHYITQFAEMVGLKSTENDSVLRLWKGILN